MLSAFVILATVQFGSINADLVGERLTVLAEHTAAPFESAARLGLPLSTVRNADALLERARQTDNAIVAIHAFDAEGHIVHSTESPTPVTISIETAGARANAQGEPWHVEAPSGFLSGIEIKRRDGTSVGGIMIVYSAGRSVTRVLAMGAQLGLAALAITLVAAALGAALLRVGLASQIRTFDQIDDTIAAFERDAWRSAAGGDQLEPKAKGELRALLESAETSYQVIGQTLANKVESDH